MASQAWLDETKRGRAGHDPIINCSPTQKPVEQQIKWRSGVRFTGNPEKSFDCIQRVKEKNGGVLTPAAVVDEARPKESPIHRHFEWDDAAAADRYRYDQARRLITAFVVVGKSPDTTSRRPVSVPVFQYVPSETPKEGDGYFKPVREMDTSEFRRAIQQLQRNVADCSARAGLVAAAYGREGNLETLNKIVGFLDSARDSFAELDLD